MGSLSLVEILTHNMQLFVWLLVQIVIIPLISGCETEDCSCGDWYYDDCGVHTPSQALHAGGLQECLDTCALFASFGQCNFFTFDISDGAHDNCLLYTHSAETFLKTCPVYGQPLYDTDGSTLMEHCGEDVVGCTECQNYSATPCGGFRSLDCLLTHAPIHHYEHVAPKEECANLCRNVDGARYSLYNSESLYCECYDSGVRECALVMVEQEVGTVDC